MTYLACGTRYEYETTEEVYQNTHIALQMETFLNHERACRWAGESNACLNQSLRPTSRVHG